MGRVATLLRSPDQRAPGQAARRPAARAPSVRAEGLRPSQVTVLTAPGTAPPIVHDVIKSSGTALDQQTRAFFEPRFGQDLSAVRVHTDARAAASASAVGATAYAVGPHIAFAAGAFAPGTSAGRRVLAHELTHVLQQPATSASPRGALRIGARATPAEREARDAARVLDAPALRTPKVRQRGPEPLVQCDPAPAPAPAPAAGVQEVGTFHPAPNITVDRTGQSMHISGTIKAYGSDATAANAATAQATIRQYWNKVFPDGYTVSCDIVVVYEAKSSAAWNEATIEMTQMTGPSNVNRLTHTMNLNMKDADALTWVVAHEFGHQLGLQDRYSESIASKIKGNLGLERTSTIQPGYEGNLMGEAGGATESKNVADLGTENSPSYWTDDDQVREWVARNPARLGALSAESKIRMIQRLMDGWISDEDVSAIGRICAATTAEQSGAVKAYLQRRLVDMTSIGQRTQVRVFIARMP